MLMNPPINNNHNMSRNISEIRLEEDGSDFVKSFNEVNDAYVLFINETIEKKKQDKFDIWFHKKQCLELGIYN